LFNGTMPLTPGGNKYSNIEMNMGDGVGNTGMMQCRCFWIAVIRIP